jgi:hypothetical protein
MNMMFMARRTALANRGYTQNLVNDLAHGHRTRLLAIRRWDHNQTNAGFETQLKGQAPPKSSTNKENWTVENRNDSQKINNNKVSNGGTHWSSSQIQGSKEPAKSATDGWRQQSSDALSRARLAVSNKAQQRIEATKARISDVTSSMTNRVREKTSNAASSFSYATTSGLEATKQFAKGVSTATINATIAGVDRSQSLVRNSIEKSKTAASEAVTKSATAISDAAKAGVEQSKQAVQDGLSRVSFAASSAATSTSSGAYNAVSRSKTLASEATRKSATAVTDAAKSGMEHSKRAVSERISRASSATVNAASSTVKGAYEKMTSTLRPAMSWLWWWSLAAIGVYAIATTGTKEIVHRVFPNSSNDQKADIKEEEQESRIQNKLDPAPTPEPPELTFDDRHG